jgi:hypothetical protein
LNVANLVLFYALSTLYVFATVRQTKYSGFSPNFQLIRSILFFLPFVISIRINRQFLKNTKQVVLVNITLFMLIGGLVATSLVPATLKYMSCKAIDYRFITNECLTFMENSRAYAVYFIYLFFMFFYFLFNTLLSVLFLRKDN